jgi:hypothetical protein
MKFFLEASMSIHGSVKNRIHVKFLSLPFTIQATKLKYKEQMEWFSFIGLTLVLKLSICRKFGWTRLLEESVCQFQQEQWPSQE